MDIWNDVPTADIRLQRGADLAYDFSLQAFGPPNRYMHQMFYDAVREKVLLFSGNDPNNSYSLADMWEWDGEGWNVINAGNRPENRTGFATAYDTVKNELVLFGGSLAGDDDKYSDETAVWNGESWESKYPPRSPSPRCYVSMAFDENRKNIVLFGGESLGSDWYEMNADTWIWDGENWTEIELTDGPPARAGHQVFYDPSRGTVLLFGGFGINEDQDYIYYNDLWEWDGERWTEIPASAAPSPRDSFTVAYDAARGVTVLFGGYDENEIRLNDTWAWDGSQWTELSPANRPPIRQLHAMAYDPLHEEIVLFGGEDSAPGTHCGAIYGDTWLWDGEDWRQGRGIRRFLYGFRRIDRPGDQSHHLRCQWRGRGYSARIWG